MHYFRAFAIINIVIVHLWRIPLEKNEGMENQEIIREVLFNNSTIYFIFISGFLFHHIKIKISTGQYYRKKINSVIVPFAFNAVLTWFVFYMLDRFSIYTYHEIKTNPLIAILTGSIIPHLWYIPFVSLIYLISPFLLRIPNKFFIKYIPFLFVVPMLGTRTGTDITIGQYLYFFPIYLLGMFVSMNFRKAVFILKKKQIWCFGIIIISSLFIFQIFKIYQHGEFKQLQNGIFYIQKLAIIGCLLPIFDKVSINKYEFLNKIASMSFGIYFIHYTLGRLQQPLLFKFLEVYIPSYGWGLTSLIFPFLIILECMGIMYIIKRILGGKSKYVIGY